MENPRFDLSIVIPVKDEELNILAVISSIGSAFQGLEIKIEVVFVDDGSTDSTWSQIKSKIDEPFPTMVVTGVRLAGNFGHMAAIEAGLRHCSGDYIATMDGDLQHPPSVLRRMWDILGSNDLVVAVKSTRTESYPKRILIGLFYRLIRQISGLRFEPNTGEFRLMSRKLLEELLAIPDRNQVFRFSIARLGVSALYVEFDPPKRVHGRSKYALSNLMQLATASIVTASVRPLRMVGWLSLFCLVFASFQIIFSVFSFFNSTPTPGWASLMIFMSVMFAALFASLSIIGIYLGVVVEHLKQYPRYRIDKNLEP
jgi:dolichol-phosphate mannosyltransferase